MLIAKSASELIGQTPFWECPTASPEAKLYFKLEKYNPSQSMKDRMALSMIEQAEEEGKLKPGGTIIESSSGNTASALAMLAASKGYQFIAVVDNQISEEKLGMLKAFGAQLVFVDGGQADVAAAQARREKARDLCMRIPNAFYANQADNPDNPEGYVTLAREIASVVQDIRTLVGSIGTGGSLCGTARSLKEVIPDLRVVAIEPKGSTIFSDIEGKFYQSGTGKTPGSVTPANINYSIIDEHYSVSDREAFNTARFFAKRMGILLGGSAGGVAYKSLELLNQREEQKGSTVAIMPDGGEKYLRSIFNDDWMTRTGLLDSSVAVILQQLMGLPPQNS